MTAPGINLDEDGSVSTDDGVAAVGTSGGLTTITGSLKSSPNRMFLIGSFANTSCDPSGNGEGEEFVDSTTDPTAFQAGADLLRRTGNARLPELRFRPAQTSSITDSNISDSTCVWP